MLRKIALELDNAQKAIAKNETESGFIKGCLERANSYLSFGQDDSRVRKTVSNFSPAMAKLLVTLQEEGAGKKLFSEINFLYHQIAEKAAMPIGEHHFAITTVDSLEKEVDKFPCVAVLDNLRSAFNVGAIIRTADGCGFEKMVLTGITAGVENKKVKKTSMGAVDFVESEQVESLTETIKKLKAEGKTIYALETVTGSKSMTKIDFKFPMAVIMGNEEFGILEDGLDLVDEIIHIPMYGKKNSFNVGVTFGMVAYEARKQWEEQKLKK